MAEWGYRICDEQPGFRWVLTRGERAVALSTELYPGRTAAIIALLAFSREARRLTFCAVPLDGRFWFWTAQYLDSGRMIATSGPYDSAEAAQASAAEAQANALGALPHLSSLG